MPTAQMGVWLGLPADRLLFFQCALTHPHPGAAAVFVDELDAGGFKRSTNRQIVRDGHGRFVLRTFGPPNGGEPKSCFTSEILRTPPQEATSGPNLTAGKGF
jgi:hypothetical protein